MSRSYYKVPVRKFKTSWKFWKQRANRKLRRRVRQGKLDARLLEVSNYRNFAPDLKTYYDPDWQDSRRPLKAWIK